MFYRIIQELVEEEQELEMVDDGQLPVYHPVAMEQRLVLVTFQ